MTNKNCFQFAQITVRRGEHEEQYHQFIPCDAMGLTQKDLHEHAVNYHNARSEMDTEDLKPGFFRCYDENAVAVIPKNRDNSMSMELPIYKADSEYMQNIKKFAPELIAL